MKTLKIDWLLCDTPSSDNAIPDRAIPFIRSVRQFQDNPVLASTERVLFAEGIYLFGSRVGIEPKYRHEFLPIADVEGSLEEPSFMVRSVTHGKCIQTEQIPPTSLCCEPGIDFFRYAQDFRFNLQCCQTGTHPVSFTSLCIAQSRMEDLIGENNFQKLIKKLHITPPPSVRAIKTSKTISDPLRNALHSKYQGQMQILFGHGKILEYLCALSNEILNDNEKTSPTHIERQVEDLHFALKNMEGKIPKLTELAQTYGHSARSLNQEFKRIYGESITCFVADHRLNQAHSALICSNAPIKKLSERLGYSHVNHFITAFSRKFGYPPGHLRRRKDLNAEE